MAINYVKFMRGTQALYDSLTTKDQDTLYFVYTSASAEKGKLYLGNKLISGSSSVDGEVSISDIADVVIDQNLSDGDVLVYNEATQKWESHSITEAIEMATMVGATETTDGSSGLVPVPVAGDHLKFLRGDGQWVEVIGSLSPEELATIDNLQSTVTTLVGEDEDKSVSDIVVAKVAELLIPENAQESLDTLQEIADWIQNHPSDVADLNSQLSDLQNDVEILQSNVNDLNELLNGTEEHPESGISSRVTALEDTVGIFTPVQGKYLTVSSAITYLNNSVTEMNDRLRWHELGE